MGIARSFSRQGFHMREKLARIAVWGAGIGLLSAGCQSVRHHEATVHAQNAMASLEAGRTDRALSEFRRAAAKDSSFAFALAKIGDIQDSNGDLAGARTSYTLAFNANPNDTDYAMRLGRIYRSLGELADAARSFLYACDLEPGSFKANVELANCYLQMGRPHQAEEYYSRALEIDPTSAETFQNLAVSQESQGQADLAIRSYLQSIEQNPTDTTILVNLATCYTGQRQPQMAEQALRRAIMIDEKAAVAHRQLGYCLFLQRKFEEAEDEYRRSIELQADAESHAGIGTVMMSRYIAQEPPRDESLRARAVQHWQRSLQLNPNQPKLASLVARYAPQPAAFSAPDQQASR
jgi:tetratricopeptide (TPR) repeat protein